MNTDRREFLRHSANAAAVALSAPLLAADAPRKKLGVSIATYMMRWGAKVKSAKHPGWTNALEVLDHCATLGAGCLQIGVGGWQSDFAGKVRARREQLGIALEGQIGLPKNESDVAAFENAVRGAKEAGATILRCVCQGGRRYEIYKTVAAWEQFRRDSMRWLQLAEPVCRRHRVRLAVENHKDWRVEELLKILGQFSSEWIGVNLDFGNNLALMEDPRAVVAALAPYTITTHFKDMAMMAYDDGFLLSEVPLGDGCLDLAGMKAICEQANPAVQFNLEMITRDPLPVPVLAPRYWTTFADVPARDLAATLALVKQHLPKQPLPRTSGKSPDEQLAFEESNNVKCFQYAREHLGFA